MPIRTELLIAAPMLQDYLVDKDTGLPLTNGIVTMYHDNARTTLKNWYFQSGVPGAYTYSPLPNPLTLSAVGTIQDADGNDVIPFYYPYTEDTDPPTFDPYFVRVESEGLDLQFTRENFPFVADPAEVQTNRILTNFAINGSFWRNIESVDVTSETDIVVCPGQHDTYRMPDIRFIKNVVNATPASETLTFETFAPNESLNDGDFETIPDITPEFYLNYTCTVAQAGETLKCIQIPISTHIATLKEQDGIATITVWLRNNGATNPVTVAYLQDLGTGITPAAEPVILASNVVNSNWQKFTVSFPLPSTAGLTTSAGGDDAFYMQIGFPLSQIADIDIASPSFYLGNTIAANYFETYDQVDPIINGPRTGDWRSSLNAFQPFGWVALDNGTIGDASSGSTYASINTWSLFNLLWNSFANINSNSALYWPIFDSAGVASTYGASAIADFAAHKRLSMPSQLGSVVMGTSNVISDTVSLVSGNFLTVPSSVPYFTGSPIYFIGSDLPAPLVEDTIYYSIVVNTTTIAVALTYANALAATPITLTTTGSGTITVATGKPGTFTGEPMHTQQAQEVADHTHLPSSATATNYVEVDGAPTQTLAFGADLPVSGYTATGTNLGLATVVPFNIVQPSVYYNVFLKL